MTELERKLTAALKRLSAQYEMEQRGALRAGRSLAAACRAADRAERNLAAANRAARRANDTLGRILQDARREVRRSLDLTRRRGAGGATRVRAVEGSLTAMDQSLNPCVR